MGGVWDGGRGQGRGQGQRQAEGMHVGGVG